jgi:hypothetical protein
VIRQPSRAFSWDDAPPRHHHYARIGLITIGALIVVGVVLIGVAVAMIGPGSRPASSPQAPAAASPGASPSPSTVKQAAAAPKVLIRFAGSGIENSAPFNVGSGPLTVHYSFNCASFGQSGNFVADLLYGSQSSLNSDDLPIANGLAMSGAQTTTVYPQDPGRDYYLSVNSECSWRIRVSS